MGIGLVDRFIYKGKDMKMDHTTGAKDNPATLEFFQICPTVP